MYIKANTRTFARYTTIHGLNELFLTNGKLTKIIWGTILLVSATLCAWQLYTTITEYQGAPTAMKSYTQKITDFPMVYFQVLNSLNMDKVKALGLNESHAMVILDHFPAAPLSDPFHRMFAKMSPNQQEKLRDDIKKTIRQRNFSDFGDFVKAISQQPSKDMFWFWDPDGAAEPSIVLDEFGIGYALNKTNVTSELEHMGYGIGVLVQYHASLPYSPPRGRLEQDREVWLSVGADRHNPRNWQLINFASCDIILKPQTSRLINTPQKPCTREYETVFQCHSLCKSRNQVCGKGCEWFTGQKVNQTTQLCVNAFDRGTENGSCAGDCDALCLPPCDTWNYNAQFKLSMPGRVQTWMAIMIDSLQVMVFEEYFTYTKSALFSNIGGILSLYLGASVLSFMHIVYFWTCKTRMGRIGTTD